MFRSMFPPPPTTTHILPFPFLLSIDVIAVTVQPFTVYIHSLYGLRDVVYSHSHLNHFGNLSMNSMDFPIILKYYWNIEP